MQRTFPGTAPQSPDQKQKLRALAQDRSSERIGDLAQLEGFWRQSTGAPFPWPLSVPAPFQFEIRGRSYPISDPVRIEFDADGDGKPEWIQEGTEIGKPHPYSYEKEADYESVIRIHDRSGQIHTYRTRFRILSQAAFDAEIQTVWSELKEALRRGDLASAAECIHTQSRTRYTKTFEAIPDLPQKVDEILMAIKLVEHRKGEAIYEMLAPREAKTYSYEVRFGVDFDGVWRIRSF
jgi:hypothetical protein